MIPPLDQVVVDDGRFKRLDLAPIRSSASWKSHAVRQEWARANKTVLIGYIRAWIGNAMDVRSQEQEDRGIPHKYVKYTDQYARISYDLLYGGPDHSVMKDAEIDLAGIQEVVNAIADQGDIRPPIPQSQKFVDASYWRGNQVPDLNRTGDGSRIWAVMNRCGSAVAPAYFPCG